MLQVTKRNFSIQLYRITRSTQRSRSLGCRDNITPDPPQEKGFSTIAINPPYLTNQLTEVSILFPILLESSDFPIKSLINKNVMRQVIINNIHTKKINK